MEISKIKEITVKEARINEVNISAYVSHAYDSLREILDAVCIKGGYKVLSYICIGELLKSKLSDFEYYEFDRLRWIRNSINYYGNKIELKQGKEIINKIFKIKKGIIRNNKLE